MMRLKSYILLCCLFVSALSSGCQKPMHKETQYSMGTFVEVRSADPRAGAIVFDEFRKLEAIFNIFDPKSELSRLNLSQSAIVSEPLFSVLKEAREFNRSTEGAFDFTIGPVSILWKKAIAKKEIPLPGEIQQALALTGADYVYLNETTREVRLLKAGMIIDLGGIAKGFALNRAVKRLKEAKVSSALINAGGNVFCLGDNRGKEWSVGIQDPLRENKVIKKLELKDRAVSTSGDYTQYFELNGKRYSHIIDPRTGYPADSKIASATVISSDASAGDALSTACIVLGLDKSRRILAGFPDARAALVAFDGKIHEI